MLVMYNNQEVQKVNIFLKETNAQVFFFFTPYTILYCCYPCIMNATRDPTMVNKRITGMNLVVCQNKTTGAQYTYREREFMAVTWLKFAWKTGPVYGKLLFIKWLLNVRCINHYKTLTKFTHILRKLHDFKKQSICSYHWKHYLHSRYWLYLVFITIKLYWKCACWNKS